MENTKDNILSYKGYIATIHFSSEDEVFYGKVEHTQDLIMFEAESAKGLKQSFHDSVDDYLAFCKEKGVEPNKTFKGSFNVRISPELHLKAYMQALTKGITLNNFISQAIENEIHLAH